MAETIQEGFDVFLYDGDKAFAAVRHVNAHGITIYVENAGDVVIPLSAVKDVHSEKVILDATRLEKKLLNSIRHAHNREDPTV